MPASGGSSTKPQSRICQHRSAWADHHWYSRLHTNRAASVAGHPVIEGRSWLQVRREALPVLLAGHQGTTSVAGRVVGREQDQDHHAGTVATTR